MIKSARILFVIFIYFLVSESLFAKNSYYLRCYGISRSDYDLRVYLARGDDGKFFKVDASQDDDVLLAGNTTFSAIKRRCVETFRRLGDGRFSFYKLEASSSNSEKFDQKGVSIVFANDWHNKERIKKVVVFGDSLSDDGNLFKRNLGVAPKGPYWRGRFSDGPVWPEMVASALNIPLQNWAIGASPTAFSRNFIQGDIATAIMALSKLRSWIIPVGLEQLDKYVKQERDIMHNLHLLNVGSVNYLKVAFQTNYLKRFATGEREYFENYVAGVIDDIKFMVKSVYAKGGRHILVFNLVDMSRMPDSKEARTGAKDMLTYLSQAHNLQLANAISDLKSDFGSSVSLYDAASQFDSIIENSEQYGITHPNEICFGGSCFGWDKIKDPLESNRHQFAFFDWGHPTAKIHCLLAQGMFNHLVSSDLLGKGFVNENPVISDWHQFCPHIE